MSRDNPMERLITKIEGVLDGIDRDEIELGGWWPTSTGVDFGRQKLDEVRAAIRDAHTPTDDERWLAAHAAEVRSAERERAALHAEEGVAEEPEWEYGACYQGDNGRELLWFSMGNGGFTVREAAEKEVERYADAQIKLCRRTRPGPWVPVKQEGTET